MNYEIGNPELAWLLLAVPVVVLLLIYSNFSRRRVMTKLGTKTGARRTTGDLLSALMLTLAMVLLVGACMDIRWGKTTQEVPQKGLEVVFALDVSRSMMAEDARPNRLARAKQQISDMVGEMSGDRVGLVVFAGESKQAVPLTNHYKDFRQKLDTVGIDSVSKGGSQLGIAIQAASDAFISKTSDHKTIVLFTDGEDQESRPIELAKKLNEENGVRIFTVGLGDFEKGARIPQGRRANRFVEHQGQQVWSKLNGSILQKIATETNAAYIPAGTKRVNMADVYHGYIANIEKSEFETAKINAFTPRFQWFAFPAFICLFTHCWLAFGGGQNQRSGQQRSHSRASDRRADSLASTRSKAAAILLFLLPGIASAQSPVPIEQSVAAQINAANQLVRQNKHNEAIEAFNAIGDSDHQDALNYNLAGAHYRNSDIDAATTLFSETAKSSNDRIATDSRYNLGNCHYAKSLQLAQQQPDAAIQELKRAIQQYRSALRLDRNNADARGNLERAKKLIDQLEQQKEQQDPNQQQDQQNKSDDSSQNQDQKDPNDSESQSNEQQNSEENSSQDQQSQEQDGDQSQEQSSEQSSDDQQKNQSQKSDDKGSDDEQSEDNNSGQQKEEASKAPPKGEVTAANENEAESGDSKMNPANPNEEQEAVMSRQEAMKLLQAVRDRDMLRRLRQQQRQRQRRIKVEKDW